ncbi:MAG: hypothetical protein Q6363_004085 [Candidatus Njordarchaeota archaeon]
MDTIVIVMLGIIVVGVLIFLLSRRKCAHEWKRIYSESMWESNVRITVYQCVKCGKIKKEYKPV